MYWWKNQVVVTTAQTYQIHNLWILREQSEMRVLTWTICYIHKIVMSRHRYGDGFLFCNGLDASQTSQAPASVRLIVGTSKKCQTFSFSSGSWSDVPDMKVRSRVKCNDEMNVAFSVFYMLLCSSLPPLSCWGCRTQREFSSCFSMRERVAALLWASLEVCGLCQGTIPQRVVSLIVICHKRSNHLNYSWLVTFNLT